MADTIAGKYNEEFFKQLTALIKRDYPAFETMRFMELIYDEHWDMKAFKQRVRHISETLRKTLPESYSEAVSVLLSIAPECRGVEYLCFPDFVEAFGLNDWDVSIQALERLTPYSSSEFAVRPFIILDPESMMEQMQLWANHPDHHVRRLASEGCRSRLPWAMALDMYKADPAPIIPILKQLNKDTSVYVQKSVANNLNDISKDHPELVKQLAREWYGESPQTNWIIKHGCRGLLRKADPDVLSLFGFILSPDVTVSGLTIDRKTLSIGENLIFSFSLRTNTSESQRLRVEYGVDFVKANGTTSRKLFKITENNYDNAERIYSRTHKFKDLTTRKHYPGMHRLSIIINGNELAAIDFDVTTSIEPL